MVTQSYKASKSKNDDKYTVVEWPSEKRAELKNHPKTEITQKLPISHIPYFLR